MRLVAFKSTYVNRISGTLYSVGYTQLFVWREDGRVGMESMLAQLQVHDQVQVRSTYNFTPCALLILSVYGYPPVAWMQNLPFGAAQVH